MKRSNRNEQNNNSPNKKSKLSEEKETTQINYYVPPKAMFGNSEINLKAQAEYLYTRMKIMHKHKSSEDRIKECMEDYLSKHIIQDIDGEKFSPQQIEWFWESTVCQINFLLRGVYSGQNQDIEGATKMIRCILVPILNCGNEYLNNKVTSYCKDKGFNVFYKNKETKEAATKNSHDVSQESEEKEKKDDTINSQEPKEKETKKATTSNSQESGEKEKKDGTTNPQESKEKETEEATDTTNTPLANIANDEDSESLSDTIEMSQSEIDQIDQIDIVGVSSDHEGSHFDSDVI